MVRAEPEIENKTAKSRGQQIWRSYLLFLKFGNKLLFNFGIVSTEMNKH